jgi:transcriptional regulator with PAS, ATPase and Fis domain
VSFSDTGVDVRILAATDKDPEAQLQQGRMREDFFFRLGVITIRVPPLRERKEDLPLLIDYFLTKWSRGKARPLLPLHISQMLSQHEWPGNIRELQNVLQRYLTLGCLEFPGSNSPPPRESRTLPNGTNPAVTQHLQDQLDAYEKHCLRQVLEQHHWHKGQTAAALGLERKTLYRKMKKFGLI